MEKKEIVLEHIKNLIIEEKINIGDKLPSENILSKELKLSRVVVREALGILEKNNIIRKRHGWGSELINTDTYKKKKYIIITILYKYLIDEYTYSYKYTIDKLQKLIKNNGYTPIYIIQNNQNDPLVINIDKKDIAGIFAFLWDDNVLYDFYKANIPIIHVFDTSDNDSIFPTVNIHNKDYYFKLFDIIKDEKKVLFFYFARKHFFPNPSYFREEGIKKIIEEKHHIVNIEYNEKINLSETVPIHINNIEEKPKYIVIWDDNIFKFAQNHWYNYLDKNPYVKLITFTNKNLKIQHENIIKIEIDLDKIAEESMKLMNKYINKETVLTPNINVKYRVY